MESTESKSPSSAEPRAGRRAVGLEIALVFAVFAIHAGGAVPAVNETHYLSKAKHFWDSAFCSGDLFLESADSHVVFYWAFGWLTRFVSLDVFAWCGRLATWGLLACAWWRLNRALTKTFGFAVLSAGLFVTLSEWFHMAGEWVVGGFEAKGLAYVLMLLALEALVRERWGRTWLLLGAASAFHVLVGGWTAVAVAVVWLFSRRDRPTLISMLPAIIGGGMLALLGLWPALALDWGADTSLVHQAHVIYVHRRLSHHLVFSQFPLLFIARHLALWGAWAALAWFVPTPTSGATRRLLILVWACCGIAVVGAAIGIATSARPELGATLLRYYWFRPSDVMTPLGVAILCSLGLDKLVRSHLWTGRYFILAAVLLIGCHLSLKLEIRMTAAGESNLTDSELDLRADWREACRWIDTGGAIASDARFLTPRANRSEKWYTHFKWYAQRAEVVAWKDIPQDTKGIVRWWERMRLVHYDDSADRWRPTLAEVGERQLQQWGQRLGADYVITTATPPLELPQVHQNRSYAIYRLSE